MRGAPGHRREDRTIGGEVGIQAMAAQIIIKVRDDRLTCGSVMIISLDQHSIIEKKHTVISLFAHGVTKTSLFAIKKVKWRLELILQLIFSNF